MFTDARTLESGTTLEVDLCVVGAGAAGLATTLDLVGSRHSVAIVESGGMKPWPRARRLANGKARGWPVPLRDRYLHWTRNRMFGGLGDDWHGSCRELDREDLAERDWAAYSGWPLAAEELASYNARARGLLGVDGQPADDADSAQLIADDESFSSSWLSLSPQPSIAERLGDRFAAAANVDVLLHANVVAVELDRAGRRIAAVAVRCLNGPRLEVRARHFVLAAGALENARLLLASNAQRPAGLGNGSDLVGRCFMDQVVMRAGYLVIPGRRGPLRPYDAPHLRSGGDHPVRAILRPTARLQERHELLNSLITLSPVEVTEVGDFASEAGRLAAAARKLAPGQTLSSAELSYAQVTVRGEQLPSHDSRIRLGDNLDELGMPQIDLNWRLGDHDVWSLRTTARLLAESFGRRLLGRMRVRPQRPFNKRHFAAGGHQSGTTRMSREPSKGVVDPDCRVHELPNLFIAGSAVFPTSGCSGPMLTTIALSLRLGEHLRRLLG
jgi:choline dehydrogenase-like flavoprotein